ncbi:MAG: hypothetical protein QM582_09200 [Micropruina sp.]|uniref:hypothetical protein n=1 Tax=Micropruina sp. TaxID=2737536 RepID=UPI0039E3B13E
MAAEYLREFGVAADETPGRRMQARLLLAALSVTLFALVSSATVGFFFVPLVLVLWSAVLVPRALSRGFDLRSRPLWRVVLAVVPALPGVLLAAGMLSGAVAADWGSVGLGVVALATAGLVAAGFRSAFVAVAVLGALGMIATVVDPSMLLAAPWLLGGVWLALGLTGAALTGSSPAGR